MSSERELPLPTSGQGQPSDGRHVGSEQGILAVVGGSFLASQLCSAAGREMCFQSTTYKRGARKQDANYRRNKLQKSFLCDYDSVIQRGRQRSFGSIKGMSLYPLINSFLSDIRRGHRFAWHQSCLPKHLPVAVTKANKIQKSSCCFLHSTEY